MIAPREKSVGTFLLITLLALIVDQVIAGEYPCKLSNVYVHGGDPDGASLVCDGAERASAFLGAQGLDVAIKIDIELVTRLANRGAAGHLHASGKKALVLDYSEFLKFGNWLRVPIDVEIYRALVAHEVAHVIAAHNFQIPKPTVQAHEYIAYVTTFATLDTPQRMRVLGQFSGNGFETEQQMNATIYLCDPMRFGAEAYRHFIKKGADADYFDLILVGDVMSE